MGDSFSSGEGAYSYELGTDENGERMWPDGNGGYFKQGVANKCHLSRNSYPYLISNMTAPLNDFRSIACSGATTKHYTSEQKDRHEVEVSPLGKWLPGYRPQREYLREASPSVVTITMGGNDIGFADIVRECVIWPDVCYRSLEYRQELAERVHNLYGELVQLYSDMRATSNNARVYVLG
ncbi:hypothetical protein IRY61_06700, partial [Candidatus Saccharibacteria bacterium]|nr:hypothetical protein [Candidatus Saccharibacteria bacterium]